VKDAQPPGPRWLRRRIGDEFFQEVVWVKLDETKVTDDDLRLIGKLRGVTSLSLNFTAISDQGLAQIAQMSQLKYLGLSRTRITSRGIRDLAEMKDLQNLHIDGTQVDDGGLETIGSFANLRMLGLGGTQVTSTGIGQLSRLPELRFLSLSLTTVDDAVLDDLVALPKLEILSVDGTQLSGQGLLTLREALPECEFWGDDTADLSPIRGEFSARGWQQIASRLEGLNGERRLKLVDLSGTLITDSQLADLHNLNHVQLFDLRETPNLTDEAVESLRLALPNCVVRR
jgi:Leucine-rich repeat (LRR) protein